jgi:hypothetical protein
MTIGLQKPLSRRCFQSTLSLQWGCAVAQWLRHYATNRQVAASIPDDVIGIFQWHNPSGRTMALGLTQPLTEMSTRCISWGWRQPVCKADNLTTILCRMSWNLRTLTSGNPLGHSRPVTGLLYLLLSLQWGHAVAQLVEALRYKPEVNGFDFRCRHWNFSLT